MSGSSTKMSLDDDLSTRKGIASTFNYSRDKLLEFGQCKAAKEPPKMFDFSGADDKRIEKIRHVLKGFDNWGSVQSKYNTFRLIRKEFARFPCAFVCAAKKKCLCHNSPFENVPLFVRCKVHISIDTKMLMLICNTHFVCRLFYLRVILSVETGEKVASKSGVAENAEQVRTNFQQMISAAVSNAHQQNAESGVNRRRIGSGRIPESNYDARENIYAIGMDARYMCDKLFKADEKVVKNWKSCNDTKRNHTDSSSQADDNDNADAKSDEPEWANCGPIS